MILTSMLVLFTSCSTREYNKYERVVVDTITSMADKPETVEINEIKVMDTVYYSEVLGDSINSKLLKSETYTNISEITTDYVTLSHINNVNNSLLDEVDVLLKERKRYLVNDSLVGYKYVVKASTENLKGNRVSAKFIVDISPNKKVINTQIKN